MLLTFYNRVCILGILFTVPFCKSVATPTTWCGGGDGQVIALEIDMLTSALHVKDTHDANLIDFRITQNNFLCI